MLTKFWEAAGGKLVDRWLLVSVPALVFWFGGALAWVKAAGGWSAVDAVVLGLSKQSGAAQGGLLIGTLVLASGSGLLVTRLTEPALRLAEGYWPSWALNVWRRLSARSRRRAERRETRWQTLRRRIGADDPALQPADFAEFLRLDHVQRRQPSAAYRRMPTRIGAILRAAESWPLDKYGLETTAVWPRLWLLLPETTRTELLAARRAMTSAVAAALWGVLFTGFGVLTLWAIPVGLGVFLLALCGWLPRRTQAFADLLEAAFDLHRTVLYQHLRWPLPNNPAEERAAGQALTTYLWRGSDATEPRFLP